MKNLYSDLQTDRGKCLSSSPRLQGHMSHTPMRREGEERSKRRGEGGLYAGYRQQQQVHMREAQACRNCRDTANQDTVSQDTYSNSLWHPRPSIDSVTCKTSSKGSSCRTCGHHVRSSRVGSGHIKQSKATSVWRFAERWLQSPFETYYPTTHYPADRLVNKAGRRRWLNLSLPPRSIQQ
jgi:hypothetical protein